MTEGGVKGSPIGLFKHFREVVGLSEADAHAAALDAGAADRWADTIVGVTFGRLTSEQARQQMLEVGEAAARRGRVGEAESKAASATVTQSDVDRIVSEAFRDPNSPRRTVDGD